LTARWTSQGVVVSRGDTKHIGTYAGEVFGRGRRTKTIQDIVNTATEQGTEAGGREQGPE